MCYRDSEVTVYTQNHSIRKHINKIVDMWAEIKPSKRIKERGILIKLSKYNEDYFIVIAIEKDLNSKNAGTWDADDLEIRKLCSWTNAYNTGNCGYEIISYFTGYDRSDTRWGVEWIDDGGINPVVALFKELYNTYMRDCPMYIYSTADYQEGIENALEEHGWEEFHEFLNDNSGNMCKFWKFYIEGVERG